MKPFSIIRSLLFSLVLVLFAFGQSANAQSNLKKATELYENFDFQSAIPELEKILKKDKGNKEAAIMLADCYRQTSNTRKAEIQYRKVSQRYSKDRPELLYYYAHAMMSNGKYKEAGEKFREYTEKEPSDRRGWNFMESCENIELLRADSAMYSLKNFQYNTDANEFSPVFFKDGIVFASDRSTGLVESKSGWTGNAYTAVFQVAKNGYRWGKPEPLKGWKAHSYHEGPACFNQRGDKMYITRNVSKSKGRKGGEVNLKIYESRWDGNKWSEPREMGFNSDHFSCGHPALSPDGKRLYFTSDMDRGYGGKDLYYVEFNGGRWGKPQNLGKRINTKGDEMFPTVLEDGTLYFASDGLGGFGGLDIFEAKPVMEDWEISNFGSPVNGSKDDFGLILSEDRRSGYFNSNRKARGSKGGDDLYLLSINEQKAMELVSVPVGSNSNTVNKKSAEPYKLPSGKSSKEVTYPKISPEPASSPNAKKNNSYDARPSTAAKPVVQPPVSTRTKPPTTNVSGRPTSKPSYVPSSRPTTTSSATVVDNERQAPFSSPPVSVNEMPNMNPSDGSYVLTGVALSNGINKRPLGGVLLELRDLRAGTYKTFVAKENGNFYFSLLPDREYELINKGYHNHAEDREMIKTYNPPHYVIHKIIYGPANGSPNTHLYKKRYNDYTPTPESIEYKQQEQQRYYERQQQKNDNRRYDNGPRSSIEAPSGVNQAESILGRPLPQNASRPLPPSADLPNGASPVLSITTYGEVSPNAPKGGQTTSNNDFVFVGNQPTAIPHDLTFNDNIINKLSSLANAEQIQAKHSSSRSYKAQVGAYNQSLLPSESIFQILREHNMAYQEDYDAANQHYLYSVGNFVRASDAQKLANILREIGFSDSFVTTYQNGVRVK